MKWVIEYYTKPNGESPIMEFIDNLPLSTKARTFKTFDLLENYGLQIGEPHIKYLSNKLWELRIKASEGIYRFLFTIKKNRVIILLHAIHKKSRKIPKKELEIALRRMKQLR